MHSVRMVVSQCSSTYHDLLVGETIGRHDHQYVDIYDDTMCCMNASLITAEAGMKGRWVTQDVPKPHQPRSDPGMFTIGN